MKSYHTDQLRNMVLLSHGGAGKTSLAEAMLFQSGAITRLGRVDDGTTTSDYDAEEVKRKISINLSLVPCEWRDHKINIVDTPGYADFVGEVFAGVRVADAAVITVCAVSGVEVGTELVWCYADEHHLPRLVFINKLDRENADFHKVLQQLQRVFGPKCVALQLPIGSQASFSGVVDLISQKGFTGPKGTESEVPVALQGEVSAWREKLVEAVAETDDTLIEKYLEGEGLSEEELRQGLKAAVLKQTIVPVLAGSALQNVGITALLDGLCTFLPSPRERGGISATNLLTDQPDILDPDVTALLTALVFKATADPYVGKLTYFRVYSGVLNSDSQVWNANKGQQERLGQLFVVRGKSQEPAGQVVAGDMGAVAKLAETGTGDCLCLRDRPYRLQPIYFPKPNFSVAVSPKTKADLDKLGMALARLAEEDPTLQVYKEPDTSETILCGMGDSHVEVAAEKMRRKFGVDVSLDTPKVSYKETITLSTKAEYRHKKQTGGHGQYGHVFLELTPLPRGAGREFTESVVGGVVPKNYIPAVQKGVMEAMEEGVLAHYPVADVKANLYDGSYHSVDSSDMSFKIAGLQAFKKGVLQGQPVLLEPIMHLQVTVPESVMGDVIGDLNGKRARVVGTTSQGNESIVEAYVPQGEMLRYATELRSLTQGRGSYSIEFSHYEEVPAHIASKVVAAAKKERGADRG